MRLIALLAVAVLAAGCSLMPGGLAGGLTGGPVGGGGPSVTALAGPQAAGPGEAPRLGLARVAFERLGDLPRNSAVSDDMLQAVAAPWLGQDVTLEDLRRLATGMEATFRSAGYPYVRVVLPPQQVEDGTVMFQVIEGRIDGIVVLGKSPAAKRQAEAQLAPLDGLGPVPVARVEGAIAALSDVPGLDARVSIARGSEGAGTMRIIAEAERKPPRFLVNFQNWGSESLGREGATLLARVPGIATYGDQFEASFFTTREWEEQFVGQLAYERTLTARGLKLRAEATYGEAEPGGAVATLGASAKSLTASFEVRHPVHRDRTSRLDVGAGFNYADLKGELFQQTVLLSDDKVRTAYAFLEAETALWGFTGDIHLEARKGVDVLSASRRGDANLARKEADPDAASLRGEARITTPSVAGFRLDLRAMGQYANRPLMAVEEFSFGNYTILRGYDPGAATGDTAMAVSAELAGLGYRPFGGRSYTEWFGFFEAGEYWNRDINAVANRTLTSFGGGMRTTFDDYLRVEIAYAAPLRAPLGQGEGVPDQRVMFSVTANLGHLAGKAAAGLDTAFAGLRAGASP